MKRFILGLLFLGLIGLIHVQVQTVMAEDWVYVGSYTDGTMDYFDKDSVKKVGPVVYSRYKTIYPSAIFLTDALSYVVTISETKDDCLQKTSVVLRMAAYDVMGHEIVTETFDRNNVMSIGPGTNGEFYQNMVCSRWQLSKRNLDQLIGL